MSRARSGVAWPLTATPLPAWSGVARLGSRVPAARGAEGRSDTPGVHALVGSNWRCGLTAACGER